MPVLVAATFSCFASFFPKAGVKGQVESGANFLGLHYLIPELLSRFLLDGK